jgi:hypothetical protein
MTGPEKNVPAKIEKKNPLKRNEAALQGWRTLIKPFFGDRFIFSLPGSRRLA